MTRIAAVTLFIGLCTILGSADGSLAQERVYTWTDENGVVHISNRKPNRNVKVQDVEDYSVSQGKPKEQQPQISVKSVEPAENQKQIDRYEKVAREAEQEAEKARKFAEEARKAADDFRDKLGAERQRWRKNRSRIKKLDEQAKLAGEQARAAAEIARAAREAAEALKREPAVEAPERSRP